MERVLTVSKCYQGTDSDRKDRTAPYIRLLGKWLESCEIFPGDSILVTTNPDNTLTISKRNTGSEVN